jgi:hypothetical protein
MKSLKLKLTAVGATTVVLVTGVSTVVKPRLLSEVLPRAPWASPVQADPATSASESSTLAERLPSPDHCSWRVGQSRAWKMRTTTELTLDAAGLGLAGHGASPVSQVRFEGTLSGRVLRTSVDGSAVWLARWTQLSEDARKGGEGMESAFLLELDRRCGVRRFGRLATTDMSSARAQQASIADFGFRAPLANGEAFIAATGFGEFSASLALGSDEKGPFVQRTITAFRQVWGGRVKAEQVQLGTNRLTVRASEGPWFDGFEGRHQVTVPGAFSSDSTQQAEPGTLEAQVWDGVSITEADYVWVDLLPQAPVAPAKDVARSEPELERQRFLAKQSFSEAMDLLAGTMESTTNIDAQWKDLTLFLEARPEQVPAIQQALRSQEFPSKVQDVVYLSLGKARGPEPRDALRAMAADTSLPPMDRIRSAVALAGRNDVGMREATELLAQAKVGLEASDPAAKMYGRNALLAAGMLAGMRRNELIAQAVRDEVEPLLSTSDALLREAAFATLGNLGEVKDLELLERWSREPDIDKREDAPLALRRMPLAQAGDFELAWLQRETSPDVKRELWHVLDKQLLDEQLPLPERFIPVAVKDLRAQHPVLTRQTLIKLLATVVKTSPSARGALLAQAPIELEQRSGLYSLIAEHLPADEMSAALAPLLGNAFEPGITAPNLPAEGRPGTTVTP